jgi:hypothetical protein
LPGSAPGGHITGQGTCWRGLKQCHGTKIRGNSYECNVFFAKKFNFFAESMKQFAKSAKFGKNRQKFGENSAKIGKIRRKFYRNNKA